MVILKDGNMRQENRREMSDVKTEAESRCGRRGVTPDRD